MDKYTFFAVASGGLESLLAEELKELGGTEVKETKAGVFFSADLASAYRISMWSRLSTRILLQLAEDVAESIDELYQVIAKIAWETHFDAATSFAVNFSGRLRGVTHSVYAAQRIKDAVVDRFKEQQGTRPNVDTDNPEFHIHVHCYKRQVRISFDFSGALHQRGYRIDQGTAPLRETLAAAIIERCAIDFQETPVIFDPLCGSGTLLIEAAYRAMDLPAGYLRKAWGFLHWQQHHPILWAAVVNDAETKVAEQTKKSESFHCYGVEIDPSVVEAAERNVARAGLEDVITIVQADCFEFDTTSLLKNKRGLILSNLPYGERILTSDEMEAFYGDFGDWIQQFEHWRAGLFVEDAKLIKRIPFRWQQQYKIKNANLDCLLYTFHLDPEQKIQRFDPYRITKNWRENLSPGALSFCNRLEKNIKKLSKWRKKEAVECYRMYDADIPEYAAAVDWYEGQVHIQEYQAPKSVEEKVASHRLNEMIHVCVAALNLRKEDIVVKTRERQSGTKQYQKNADEGHRRVVHENALKFYINLKDYLDTGLFLDHRLARAWLRDQAENKRFLNLFAYTGTASVYAAAGGAKTTCTVDMSKTYLKWAKDNMALNGFTGAAHSFINEDCLDWLSENRQSFDLIFLDPPTFSNSKKMKRAFDIQTEHPSLIRLAMKALSKSGVLLFSNNFRRFKLEGSLAEEFEVKELSTLTLSPDFARNKNIHNSWLFQHKVDA